jgi:glycosyltransferase involved in cell wall biosynthesis
MKPTLSVIIPALNEEKNIVATVENVLAAIDARFEDYELIVFDDGSTDETAALIDGLAAGNNRIRAVHNSRNMGFGYNYRKGVELSRYQYISMIPGDNEIAPESIKDIYGAIGQADIVIPYTRNYWVRPKLRRFLSKGFTLLMNGLFGLRLNYFNGPVVHKRQLLQSVGLSTDSFAFQAEALVKLIRARHSYVQVAMTLQERSHGVSKALRLKNIIGVLQTVIKLFIDVVIVRRSKHT